MILFIDSQLNEYRERIKGIDYSIVSLISRRIELARNVGRLKQELKLPIKNYQVEKQVYERIHNYGKEFDLDQNYLHAIFEQIIASSVDVQKNDLPETQNPISNLRFLLIGGGGQMGTWFRNFLVTSGHHVTILDPRLEKSSLVLQQLPSDLNRFDYIGIMTPLHSIPEVLQQLSRFKPEAIIFEIGSLKSHIRSNYEKLEKQGLKIISCHPLFGPDVINLDGRNLIVCNNDLDLAHFARFNSLFEETSLNILDLPLVDHDKIMLYTIGLSHFLNLLHGQILHNSPFNFEILEKFASTTFNKQINTTREVYSENPMLYHAIQSMNDYRDELYNIIVKSFNELRYIVSKEEHQEFEKLMLEVNNYFNKKSLPK